MWNLVKTDKHFFTPDQRAQCEALFEAILPGSETNPGARDANAVEYIDSLLTMSHEIYFDIPNLQKLYPAGLAAIDAASKAAYGASVTQIATEQAANLLQQMKDGKLPGAMAPTDQTKFFANVRAQCIEGCFGDPRWGGNQNGIMWRWYGWIVPAERFQRTTLAPQKLPIKKRKRPSPPTPLPASQGEGRRSARARESTPVAKRGRGDRSLESRESPRPAKRGEGGRRPGEGRKRT